MAYNDPVKPTKGNTMPKDKDPIVVVVANGRYDTYGNPVSIHHNVLADVLMGMGGVNESVPDGTYHFSTKQVGLTTYATLEAAPTE